jgi:rhodanese-related sulfurtransferase
MGLDLSVTDLKTRLDAGEKPNLLDVREGYEVAAGALPGATHIPMGNLQFDLKKLEGWKGQEVVVYCRSGGRSAAAQAFLESNGFTNVRNLSGGVTAWKAMVDPSFVVG